MKSTTPVRPVLLRRVDDVLIFGGDDGFGPRAVRYLGWGRPSSPDPDPVDRLSGDDWDGPAGLLTSWTRGVQSSPALHVAIVAARGGTKACQCAACRRARAPRPEPSPDLEAAVQRARETPMADVLAALGMDGFKRQGRTLRGPCPVHGGERPSFSAGAFWWRCHACGEHGDALDLVRRVRGVGFHDAAAFVASI